MLHFEICVKEGSLETFEARREGIQEEVDAADKFAFDVQTGQTGRQKHNRIGHFKVIRDDEDQKRVGKLNIGHIGAAAEMRQRFGQCSHPRSFFGTNFQRKTQLAQKRKGFPNVEPRRRAWRPVEGGIAVTTKVQRSQRGREQSDVEAL